jgi:acetyl-CoA acyltransferase
MPHAVICAYKRSPFHFASKGALKSVRADDMVAHVIQALVAESKMDASALEDIIMGCAFPEGEQGFNVARLTALIAGLPLTVGGMTINRFCGSSMSSVHYAAGQIALGAGEMFIAAGVESMSRIPMGGFNPMPNPALAKASQAYISMGITAENVAKKYGITRAMQEEFALHSQQKAAAAHKAGHFKDEIVPIATKAGLVEHDGTIRADTSLEGLAGLKPAFDAAGTVTAGTASPLTDGAAALLVTSEDYAKKHGLPILARIIGTAICGLEPELMGMGPVESSRKALARAGISEVQLDVVEINEAFASQSLACCQELALDMAKVNIDGGAIAMGHPLGATGARITGKAAALLHRTGGKYALATQCIGVGQGIATVLEAVA